MYIKKYTLRIPFKLNGNSNISVEDDETVFDLKNYNVKVDFDNKYEGVFRVNYFKNYDEIYLFYEDFKILISLLNLDSTIWSIKIKDLNKRTIHQYVQTEYDVDNVAENQIIIKPSSISIIPGKIKPIQAKPLQNIIQDIKFYYSKWDQINFEKNKKLKTAVEFYTNSYFQDFEVRFLTYIIVLELLKPNIKRKGVGKECVDKIKSVVMDYKKDQRVIVNEDLKKEVEEIESSLNYFPYRSIGYSLQRLANESHVEIEEFEDINIMIRKSYKVRSKYVHNGEIINEFDECFNFLMKFIPVLIKSELDNLI